MILIKKKENTFDQNSYVMAYISRGYKDQIIQISIII